MQSWRALLSKLDVPTSSSVERETVTEFEEIHRREMEEKTRANPSLAIVPKYRQISLQITLQQKKIILQQKKRME